MATLNWTLIQTAFYNAKTKHYWIMIGLDETIVKLLSW